MKRNSGAPEIDRRVLRTRRLLKEALLELVKKKDYDKITIRDVTDQADIGYATFFRHYDGVDDLMLKIFSEIIDELESLPEKHEQDYFKQEGVLLFEHVLENHWLYQAIFKSHTFSRRLRAHIGEMMLIHLRHHQADLAAPTFSYEIAATHMASSLLGLIEWWLESGQPVGVGTMAEIYERLVVRATWQALTPGRPIELPWEEAAGNR